MAFLPIVEGAAALGGLYESAQANSLAAKQQAEQARIAKLQEQWMKLAMTYGKEVARKIMDFYNGNDPAYQQMIAANERAGQSYITGQARDTLMQAQRAGGGTLGTSSTMQNLALALNKQGAGEMATNRSKLVPQEQALKLNALGMMQPIISGGLQAGAQAGNTYGDMSQINYGRSAQYAQAAGRLARVIGMGTGGGAPAAQPNWDANTPAGAVPVLGGNAWSTGPIAPTAPQPNPNYDRNTAALGQPFSTAYLQRV